MNLPTVLVNARIPRLAFATVSTDDGAAAEQALPHLHQLGHRRIGMLMGPADHIPSQRKLAAARALLERLGTPLSDEMIVNGLYSLESGQAGGSRLFGNGATAVVCASDPLALGAVRAARRAGLRVPQDVSVVGFDDSALMSLHRAASDDGPPADRGDGPDGHRALLSQIAGTAAGGDELLFEPELVLRGSTGPVAA
ncbi:substrate-binding domain-containing protein [Microbacterium elymi]|uniref:Substrate-binding domain-containing protein n=1 Tax=Microbacterium elymi TaxID=2909587 RepID=A0ABY5NNE1_9MICO|nr:substrate-binding domain-containing protein [Microbacterium elymi]UUT36653.1 substrate-binding domain-containing protein [Microbacterium elymi]